MNLVHCSAIVLSSHVTGTLLCCRHLASIYSPGTPCKGPSPGAACPLCSLSEAPAQPGAAPQTARTAHKHHTCQSLRRKFAPGIPLVPQLILQRLEQFTQGLLQVLPYSPDSLRYALQDHAETIMFRASTMTCWCS